MKNKKRLQAWNCLKALFIESRHRILKIKRAHNTLDSAIRRMSNAQRTYAWQSWKDTVAECKLKVQGFERAQRITNAALRRIAHQALSQGWESWKNLVHAQNKLMREFVHAQAAVFSFLRRTSARQLMRSFFRWKAGPGPDEIKAVQFLRQIVSKLQHRHYEKAWVAWSELVRAEAMQVRGLEVARRILDRLLRTSMGRAWRRWWLASVSLGRLEAAKRAAHAESLRTFASYYNCSRRLAASIAMSSAWRQWTRIADHIARRFVLAKHFVRRMNRTHVAWRRRCLSKAWAAVCRHVDQFLHHQRTAAKMLRRWGMRKLTAVVALWRRATASVSRREELTRSLLRALQGRHTKYCSKAWKSWRGMVDYINSYKAKVADGTARLRRLKRRLVNRQLAMGWKSWSEAVNAAREVEEQEERLQKRALVMLESKEKRQVHRAFLFWKDELEAYRAYLSKQSHGRKRVEKFRQRMLQSDILKAWNQWYSLVAAAVIAEKKEAELRLARDVTKAAHTQRVHALMASAANRGLRQGFHTWKAAFAAHRAYMASVADGTSRMRGIRGRLLHKSLSLAWRCWLRAVEKLRIIEHENEIQRGRVTRIMAATMRRGIQAAWVAWISHVHAARTQEASAARLIYRFTNRFLWMAWERWRWVAAEMARLSRQCTGLSLFNRRSGRQELRRAMLTWMRYDMIKLCRYTTERRVKIETYFLDTGPLVVGWRRRSAFAAWRTWRELVWQVIAEAHRSKELGIFMRHKGLDLLIRIWQPWRNYVERVRAQKRRRAVGCRHFARFLVLAKQRHLKRCSFQAWCIWRGGSVRVKLEELHLASVFIKERRIKHCGFRCKAVARSSVLRRMSYVWAKMCSNRYYSMQQQHVLERVVRSLQTAVLLQCARAWKVWCRWLTDLRLAGQHMLQGSSSIGRLVSRWSNKQKVTSLQRWQAFARQSALSHHSIGRAVSRCRKILTGRSSSQTSRALALWVEMMQTKRFLRRTILRMCSRKLFGALKLWHEMAVVISKALAEVEHAQKLAQMTMKSALSRCRGRFLFSGLQAWKSYAMSLAELERAKEHQRKLCLKTFGRLLHGLAASAFQQWHNVVTTDTQAVAAREQASRWVYRILTKMQRQQSAASFGTWITWARAEAVLDTQRHKLRQKMLHKALGAGFRTWLAWTRSDANLRVKRELLTKRVLSRTLSAGFTTWLAWARVETEIIHRRQKLKARMLNKAIAAGFRAWVVWFQQLTYQCQLINKLCAHMRTLRAYALAQALRVWFRNSLGHAQAQDQASRVFDAKKKVMAKSVLKALKRRIVCAFDIWRKSVLGLQTLSKTFRRLSRRCVSRLCKTFGFRFVHRLDPISSSRHLTIQRTDPLIAESEMSFSEAPWCSGAAMLTIAGGECSAIRRG